MMRQPLITLGLAILLLCSCEPSREKVINRLVETEICNGLINPRSYDPIDMKIDSAFTPLDDMEFYTRIEQFWETCDEAADVRIKLDSLEAALSILKGYMGILNPENIWGIENTEGYQNLKTQCNEKLQAIRDDYSEIISEAKEELDSLKKTLKAPETFIGYHVQHRYRSKNTEGKLQLDTLHLFINTELEKITTSIKDQEWKYMQDIYRELLDSIQL